MTVDVELKKGLFDLGRNKSDKTLSVSLVLLYVLIVLPIHTYNYLVLFFKAYTAAHIY